MHPALLLIIAPIAIGLLLWALLDLEWFVLTVLLVSLLYPGDIARPGGANVAALDVFVVVALCSWLINNALGNAPDPNVRRQKFVLACAIFAILQWVSLIWTQSAHQTLLFSIQAVELFVAIPLLFASLPSKVGNIEKGLSALLIATAALAIWLLVVYASKAQARVTGTYLPGLNKNASGSFEASGVVIAYAMLLRPGRARAWVISAAVFDVAGLIATGSRGAILGAVAGILVVSVMMKRGKIAAIAVVAVLGGVYFAVLEPAQSQKTTQAGSYSSGEFRITLWSHAIKVIESRPILGTGGGAYMDAPDGNQGDPNNTFLLTWAELGVVGILALVNMLAAFFRMLPGWRKHGDRGVTALAAACAGTFVCLLTHAQFDVSWTRGNGSLMFAMAGLLIALNRLALTEHKVVRAEIEATAPPSVVLSAA
jgi:O-antigen ligase